jgi:hypothetical protein
MNKPSQGQLQLYIPKIALPGSVPRSTSKIFPSDDRCRHMSMHIMGKSRTACQAPDKLEILELQHIEQA